MKPGKLNLYHAVVISLVLHGVLVMVAERGWIRLPAPPETTRDPDPIRFTLVETEPSPMENPNPPRVSSDADRVASAPDPEPASDAQTGTPEGATRTALARPPPPFPPGPEVLEETQRSPPDLQPEEEPPDSSLEPEEPEVSPSDRFALLESAFRRKPPAEVIRKSEVPNRPARGSRPGRFGPVQFDSKGFDFGPYARTVIEIVRKNWYAIMPWIARRAGAKGIVKLRFSIAKNGRVSDLRILTPSGSVPLDRAALGSITLSDPLPPLPRKFPREQVGVTFIYYYNLPDTGE